MKHIVFFSGGIGSWRVAKIVAEREKVQDLYCLFTDTLIEDNDLYRFMLETWSDIYGLAKPTILIKKAKKLTQVYEDIEKRKEELESLRHEAMAYFPQVVWLSYGKTPWDIYFETRFLGNSRLAKCSHVLKQEMANEWINENVTSDDAILYLGIDWTEAHRFAKPIENWAPFEVRFPLGEENSFLFKDELFWELDNLKIEVPELYKAGFVHNNCGGFCCRAGQGSMLNLLKYDRNLYLYHEHKEREISEYLGKNVAMMKMTVDKETEYLTMERLRKLYETGKKEAIDTCDFGGCGCFVS